MSRTPSRSWLLVIAAGFMAATGMVGCGGDGDGDGDDATGSPPDPESAVEDIADDLEDQQQRSGGGSASLTIGDGVWEFEDVLCAFGTEETQNDDWDFSLSTIQDGLQLSVSRGADGGRFGDSITLDDIEDFENPSVSWSAPAFVLPTPENPMPVSNDSFVEIDGKQISAEVDFNDGTTDDLTATPGTLSATCP